MTSGDIPGMLTGEGAPYGPSGSGEGFVPLGGTATTVPSVASGLGADLSAVQFDTGAATGSVTGDFSGPYGPSLAGPSLADTSLSGADLSPGSWAYGEYAAPAAPIRNPVVSSLSGTGSGASSAQDFLTQLKGFETPDAGKVFDSELLGKTSSYLRGGGGKEILSQADVLEKIGFDRAAELRVGPAAAKIIKEAAFDKAGPGLLTQSIGPLTLAGTAAYFGGAFDPPKPEDFGTEEEYLAKFEEFKRANPLFEGNPEQYTVALRPNRFDPGGDQFDPSPVSLFAANGGPAFLANGGAAFSPQRFAAPTSGARFGIPGPEISAPLPYAGDFVSSYSAPPPRGTYGPAALPPGHSPADTTSTNTFFDPDKHRVSLYNAGDYIPPEPDPEPDPDPVDESAPPVDESAPPVNESAPPGYIPRNSAPPYYDEDGFLVTPPDPYVDEGARHGGFIDQTQRPEMYGQRARALVEGPGTEKSDSIPARLSNGEFVLTARAVRGADPTGNGDRYRGAQNLYKLMRNFEMRA